MWHASGTSLFGRLFDLSLAICVYACACKFVYASVCVSLHSGEADRPWFANEAGVRDVDHVITAAELGPILKVWDSILSV
jgi:hypothetical protein